MNFYRLFFRGSYTGKLSAQSITINPGVFEPVVVPAILDIEFGYRGAVVGCSVVTEGADAIPSFYGWKK